MIYFCDVHEFCPRFELPRRDHTKFFGIWLISGQNVVLMALAWLAWLR